jgi:ferredoxin
MSGPITLKVHVDPERCQGHNRCYSIAPELFEIDEYGTARAKGDGMVPPALGDKARLAVKNCPEHAVRLTQGGAR